MFGKLWLLCCVLILSSCSRSDYDGVEINHGTGCSFISHTDSAYLDVPQNLELFKNQIQEKDFLRRQKELNARFDKIFFSPWKKDFSTAESEEFHRIFFCENLHKLSDSESQKINNNIKYRRRIAQKGIIIRNTIARNWPTNSQLFFDIRKPGESYPFDANIASLMRLGTPVIIKATSEDGKWGFVGSYAFSGWVSFHDLAYVDEKFIKKFKSGKLAVAVKDGTVIRYQNKFFNTADIGTVLPQNKNGLMCPYKKSDGFAEIVSCSSADFSSKPLRFSAENVLKISKQFLGQKYGWGGYLNQRDCSMLTMDFCTTFGIPIARNGNAQLSQGKHFSLSTNKSDFIMKNGVPFLTLVGKKGHVMLYVGRYKNKPVFMHNIWAVPSKFGSADRYVIGKTVLTSSQFGSDVSSDKTRSLEEAISLMRVL